MEAGKRSKGGGYRVTVAVAWAGKGSWGRTRTPARRQRPSSGCVRAVGLPSGDTLACRRQHAENPLPHAQEAPDSQQGGDTRGEEASEGESAILRSSEAEQGGSRDGKSQCGAAPRQQGALVGQGRAQEREGVLAAIVVQVRGRFQGVSLEEVRTGGEAGGRRAG